MTRSNDEQILYMLKSRGEQTAGAIAKRLGMTSVGARKHLQNLQNKALVAFDDRRHRVGRPKRYWSLTPKGHARFPDTHSDLTLELLDAVRGVFGDVGLDQLITARENDAKTQYAATLSQCPDTQSRVKELAHLRKSEGYMAEWRKEPNGSFLLVENHCPICAAARYCQGLCRSELNLFRNLFEPDATVDRIEHILAGARRCTYRITPRE